MATTKITSATTIDISALLKDSKGVALVAGSKAYQSALTKIANFEAAVEGNRSASLTIGKDKFSYTKLATSGTTGPQIQLKSGTSTFASATTLAAGTATTPTPAPTTTPTGAPTPAPTVAPTPAPTTAPKSLTTDAETLTGSAGNDTFKADVATLNASDSVDGGLGTDTINITTNVDVTSATTLKAIEVVNFTALGARAVDVTNITGVTNFNSNASVGAITISNLNDAKVAFGLTGGGTTNSLTVGYKAGALQGTADKLAVTLSAATGSVVSVDPGFESATLANTGSSGLTTFTAPGMTALTVTGSGTLDIGTALNGLATLNAASFTGSVNTFAGGSANSKGFSDSFLVGSSTGSTILLGTGADNIGFTGATASGSSDVVNLDGGDDKIIVNAAGTGGVNVFAGDGNDSIRVVTSALGSGDFIDGGAGTDTLTIANDASNTLVTRGLENLNLSINDVANTAQTISSADGPLVVTASIDATLTSGQGKVDVQSLPAGSTVTINSKADTTNKADAVNVAFSSTEAASTLAINSGMTGGLTTNKITKVTANLGAASTLTANVGLTAATDLTLNATGALSLGSNDIDDAASTDTLANVTVTGSSSVTLDDILSTALTSATLTAGGTGNLQVGDVGASSTKLATVSLNAAGGTLKADAIGGTSDVATLAVTLASKGNISGAGTAGTLGTPGSLVINSTKLGNVSLTTTGTGSTINAGAIGANATAIGNVTVSSDSDVTLGLIGAATAAATTVGTVSVSSTSGALALPATAVNVKASAGLNVNLSAKTFITTTGLTGGSAVLVQNEGNITATLGGAATSKVDFTSVTAKGVVSLTSTGTGTITSTITNGGTAGGAQTSTISSGDAASGKTHDFTIAGTVDTLNFTGGSGNDTIAFNSGVAIKGGTLALAGGSADSINFANILSSAGIVANFSSSAVSFDSGTSYASSISAGQVAEYVTTASTAKVKTSNINFTVSGAEIITGTASGDYIAGASTAMSITGGAGNDTIVGGAANDTILGGDGNDTVTGGVGVDDITVDAARASGEDVLTFVAADSYIGASNVLTNVDTIRGVSGTSSTGSLFTIDTDVAATAVTTAAATAPTLGTTTVTNAGDFYVNVISATSAVVYQDSNGNSKIDAGEFAVQLVGSAAITASDFSIVSGNLVFTGTT